MCSIFSPTDARDWREGSEAPGARQVICGAEPRNAIQMTPNRASHSAWPPGCGRLGCALMRLDVSEKRAPRNRSACSSVPELRNDSPAGFHPREMRPSAKRSRPNRPHASLKVFCLEPDSEAIDARLRPSARDRVMLLRLSRPMSASGGAGHAGIGHFGPAPDQVLRHGP